MGFDTILDIGPKIIDVIDISLRYLALKVASRYLENRSCRYRYLANLAKFAFDIDTDIDTGTDISGLMSRQTGAIDDNSSNGHFARYRTGYIGRYGSIFLVRYADRQAPLMMTHVTVILPCIGSEISTDITDNVIGIWSNDIGNF